MKIDNGFVASSNVTASGEYLRILVIDPKIEGKAFDAYEPSARTKCLKCNEITVHGCKPLDRDEAGKAVAGEQPAMRPDSCPSCGAMDTPGQAWGLTVKASIANGTKVSGEFRVFKDAETGEDVTPTPHEKILGDGTKRVTTYLPGVFEPGVKCTPPAGRIIANLTAK